MNPLDEATRAVRRSLRLGSSNWYKKGVKAGASGKYPSLGDAWTDTRTGGARSQSEVAHGAFMTGYFDGRERRRNSSARPCGKALTLRNMASVTIKRLPGGAVAVTGRKLGGTGRANPSGFRGARYGKQYMVGSYSYQTLASARKAAQAISEEEGSASVYMAGTNRVVAEYQNGRKLGGARRANPGRKNYALILDRGAGKRDAVLYFGTRKQAEAEARRFRARGAVVRIEKTIDASLG